MSFSFNPSLWFVCRYCKQIFPSTDKLKVHKLENHLGNCLEIKYIVFEEKYVEKEWIPPFHESSSTSCRKNTNRFLNPYVSLTSLNLTNLGTKSLRKSERNSRSRNSDKTNFSPTQIENSPKVSSLRRGKERNLNLASEKALNEKVKSQPITNNYIETCKATLASEQESESAPASTTLNFSDPEPARDIKSESEDETEPKSPSINDSNNLSYITDAQSNTIFDTHDEPEVSSSLFEQDGIPAVDIDIDPLQIAESSDCPPEFSTSLGEAEQLKSVSLSPKRRMGTGATCVLHQCSFCKKSFSIKRQLVIHERSHTGDYPFQCQVEKCRKSFTSKKSLQQHNCLVHFVELGLPQHICPVCGKVFGLLSKLNVHMRGRHDQPKKITKSQWKSERKSRARNLDNSRTSFTPTEIENLPEDTALKRRKIRGLNLATEKVIIKKVESQLMANDGIETYKAIRLESGLESESEPESAKSNFSDPEPESYIKTEAEAESEPESASINDSNNLSSITDVQSNTIFDTHDEPEVSSSLLEQGVTQAVDIDPLEIAEPSDCKPELSTSLGKAEQLKSVCPPIGSLKLDLGTHATCVSHQCSFSDKHFATKQQLLAHERTHTGDYPFQCQMDKCRKSFTSKKSLQQHNCLVHFVELGLPQYICPVCGKIFGLKSRLSRHMRGRHDPPKEGAKPYVCLVCSASFRHSSDYIRHEKIHIDNQPFKCDQCPIAFKHIKAFNRHMVTHGIRVSHQCSFCDKNFPDKHILAIHEQSHTGDCPFQCQKENCEKAFTSKSSLQQHNRLVHSEEAQQLKSVSSSIDTSKNVSRPHACQVCFASFRHKHGLERHKKIHIDDRPFKCDHCPATYKFKSILKIHMVSHGLCIIHRCSFCDKYFATKVQLENHERTHTGHCPFQCQVEKCKKTFTSNSSLQQHTCMVHSEELGLPQYTCTICGKVYGLKAKLNRHMRERHDPSKKITKPHVCPFCFASFRFRSDLNVHKKIHIDDRPFKCEHCPATFKFRNSLKNHRVTHGINVSHQCCFCGKYFTTKSSLVAHERTHTDDFPFQCQIESCRKTFSSQRLLYQHNGYVHFVELGLPQYLCSICGRIFGLQSRLNLHMREKHAPVGSEPKPKRIRPKRIRKKAKGNLDAKPLT